MNPDAFLLAPVSEALLRFCLQAYDNLTHAAYGLLWPALLFFLLGLMVKQRALFTDMRRAMAESALNVKIIAFNVVFMLPLYVAVAQGLSDFFTASGLVLSEPGGGNLWSPLPSVLVVVIAVFIGDFTGYWRHRLEHARFLWPAHAVHHSDTQMTWLTLERFHPINRLSTLIIDSSVLIMLGFPPWAVIANNLVRHYYGYFIHADLSSGILGTYDTANVPVRSGLPGLLVRCAGGVARLFVSPAMHRWHHAAAPSYYNANFATVFSVFDKWFGTYKVPGPCGAKLGVTDTMGRSLTGQLSYAFKPRAYRRRTSSAPAFVYLASNRISERTSEGSGEHVGERAGFRVPARPEPREETESPAEPMAKPHNGL